MQSQWGYRFPLAQHCFLLSSCNWHHWLWTSSNSLRQLPRSSAPAVQFQHRQHSFRLKINIHEIRKVDIADVFPHRSRGCMSLGSCTGEGGWRHEQSHLQPPFQRDMRRGHLSPGSSGHWQRQKKLNGLVPLCNLFFRAARVWLTHLAGNTYHSLIRTYL